MRAAAATSRRLAPGPISRDLEELLVDAINPTIVERVELPRRAAKNAIIPKAYSANAVLAGLLSTLCPGGSVWHHQAIALDLVASGRNALVTTGTGSGKSLVFQLPLLLELLEGNGTALVFYPQKALCSDQLIRWRKLLGPLDLPEHLVGEISGDTPMAERDHIMANARIVLATPDVVHAWLARLQAAPVNRTFLARVRYMVLDEAHALDGVFGSNCAYLFRRLQLAIRTAAGADKRRLQFIATSATISDAEAHLEQLTGRPFELVAENMNGAPARGMTVLHIEGPDRGAASEVMLVETIERLKGQLCGESLVAFVDGRQAVERITKKLADDAFLPYRSGYEVADRRSIERALSSGDLKGCVSTSALELGIDVSGFRIGFNLGLPATRKALRQRAGRVGRASPGLFAVIAPRNAFTRLGTTLEEFVLGPVEQGHLYLQNRAIQFQQACCLEKESSGGLTDAIEWPEGFDIARQYLSLGSTVPRDLKRIAQSATASPHHAFPLRQIADTRMILRLARDRARELGTINLEKALREAYPGAVYLHFRKAYRVVDWRVTAFENSILLEPVVAAAPTVPMLSAKVDVASDNASLLSEHVLASDRGSLAERCLRITEAVHGYSIGSKKFPYSTIGNNDRRLRSQYRQFESTGVVLRIKEPWFEGGSASKIERRKQVATALRALLLAERGILPGEVSQTHVGISLSNMMGSTRIDDAIVIFDDMQGGLRLTEPLFSNFSSLIRRLRRASEMAGEDALLDSSTVDLLDDWNASLRVAAETDKTTNQGQIYAPGSELGALINGDIIPRKLTGHQLMCVGGVDALMYSYDLDGGATGWVSHDTLLPVGLDWSFLHETDGKAGELVQ